MTNNCKLGSRRSTFHDYQDDKLQSKAGIVLPIPLIREATKERPKIEWFEICCDNFLKNSSDVSDIDRLRQDFKISVHTKYLLPNMETEPYLSNLNRLIKFCDRYEPIMVSGQLSLANTNFNSSLFNSTSQTIICQNINIAQESLKRQIIFRNSTVVSRWADARAEVAEFLFTLVERTGCGLILDVDDAEAILGSSGQLGKSPLPPSAIKAFQITSRNESGCNSVPVSTADSHALVDEYGWAQFALAVNEIGARPVLIRPRSGLSLLSKLVASANWAELFAEWILLHKQICTNINGDANLVEANRYSESQL